MQRLRNRWTMAASAMLLLIATSGVAISRMSCLMGGHSVISLGLADECCPEDEHGDKSTVSATCCAFSQAGGDRAELLPNAPVEWMQPALIAAAMPVEQFKGREAVALHWLDSRPPPLLGMERLTLVRCFLI